METHLDPFCPVVTNLFFFSIYMCLYVYICICLCVTYRVVLCRTVSYCVVLCRTVSYCVVPCRTVSYCVVLCRTVSYCVVLCRTVSYCVGAVRHLVRHCTTRRTSPTCRAPTPCTTLYDASYAPDASGPDTLYDAPTRRTVHFRQHSAEVCRGWAKQRAFGYHFAGGFRALTRTLTGMGKDGRGEVIEVVRSMSSSCGLGFEIWA